MAGTGSMVPLQTVQSVSVILPTFNEAGHIADLIVETVGSLQGAGVAEIEVIVVDDDSPDLTWKEAAKTKCAGAEVRVIRRMENHGLAASLADGIGAARSEVVVWMDADFSHPPDKIPQLLLQLDQGYHVAVNSRYLPGGSEERCGRGGRLQLLLSRSLNRMLRLFLCSSLSDYTSGFVAVRREVLGDITLHGDYGEYFIDFVYRVIRSGRYRICELPYTMATRRSGDSKTGSNLVQYLKRGWRYLATVLRLKCGRLQG